MENAYKINDVLYWAEGKDPEIRALRDEVALFRYNLAQSHHITCQAQLRPVGSPECICRSKTTCYACGQYKETPWRDTTGYICVACLGKKLEEIKDLIKLLTTKKPATPQREDESVCETPCDKCGGIVLVREVGDHQDCSYRCIQCGKSWWVDGPDA